MLIRFNVKNFLSFSASEDGKSEEFSMIAGKVRNKNEHIYDDKKIKLLKGYNIEFNLIIELYADKMFINAENIVVDGEKYILP